MTPATGTPYILNTVASTNASVVRASAGHLHEITVFNPTGATVYVKLFNKATAPTVGTDVPITTIPVAAGALAAYQFPPVGKRFATGLGLCVTAGQAANDTAVIEAGVQISATYL